METAKIISCIFVAMMAWMTNQRYSLCEEKDLYVEPATIDFGNRSMDEGSFEVEAKIFSRLKDKYEITKIRTSCACKTPRVSKYTLEPGDPIIASITIRPADFPGKYNGSVFFETNNPDTPILKVDLLGSFHAVSNRLLLYPDSKINFGRIVGGSEKYAVVKLYRMGDADIGALGPPVISDGRTEVKIDPMRDSEKHRYYVIKINFPDIPGKYDSHVLFEGNADGKKDSVKLEMTSEIIDPVECRPKLLKISEEEEIFGLVAINNVGNAVPPLTKIETDSGSVEIDGWEYRALGENTGKISVKLRVSRNGDDKKMNYGKIRFCFEIEGGDTKCTDVLFFIDPEAVHGFDG